MTASLEGDVVIGGHAVDADHVVADLDQALRYVKVDEARRPSYKKAHSLIPLPVNFDCRSAVFASVSGRRADAIMPWRPWVRLCRHANKHFAYRPDSHRA